ncbi:hypothetical protein DFJ77DRAFT_206671 [Powellomyces hirtus]|nr:hypothetical protein DFJ77DRAFT_206671 [Powellomyces hirtus]
MASNAAARPLRCSVPKGFDVQKARSERGSFPKNRPVWKIMNMPTKDLPSTNATTATYSYDLQKEAAELAKARQPVDWHRGSFPAAGHLDICDKAQDFDLLAETIGYVDALANRWFLQTLIAFWTITWLATTCLFLPVRAEWLAFTVFSATAFQRARGMGSDVFSTVCLTTFVVNLALWTAVRSEVYGRILPTVANAAMYLSFAVRLRDFGVTRWVAVALFIGIDCYAKDPPRNGLDLIACLHSLSHGFYCLSRTLVERAVEWRYMRRVCCSGVNGDLTVWSGVKKKSSFARRGSNLFARAGWRRRRNISSNTNPTDSPIINTNTTILEPRKSYYYSNQYQTHSRFELCVLEVRQDSATLSWTLPESLIVSLCSLAGFNPPLKAGETPRHNGLSPPLSVTALPPIGNLGALALPPQSGSATIDIADFEVSMNGHIWDRRLLRICLEKEEVVIHHLPIGSKFRVLVGIKGFWSVPVRIRTPEKIPATHVSPAIEQSYKPAEAPLPVRSRGCPAQQAKLEAKRATLESLSAQVEGLRTDKKAQQAEMKKLKKDVIKSKESLKAELEIAKKQWIKEVALDDKTASKVQEITTAAAEENQEVDNLKAEYKRTMQEIARFTSQCEVETKQVERFSHQIEQETGDIQTALEQPRKDQERAITAEMEECTQERARLQQALERLEQTVEQKRTMLASVAARADHFRRQVHATFGVRAQVLQQHPHAATEAVKNMEERNQALRETLLDERRFTNRLLAGIGSIDMSTIKSSSSNGIGNNKLAAWAPAGSLPPSTTLPLPAADRMHAVWPVATTSETNPSRAPFQSGGGGGFQLTLEDIGGGFELLDTAANGKRWRNAPSRRKEKVDQDILGPTVQGGDHPVLDYLGLGY